jgi:hypothetical protein
MIQTDRSSVMTNTKSLILAAAAALSVGLGTVAMAQESAGGYIAGPFEQQRLLNLGRHSLAAPAVNAAPQFGAADRTSTISSWPVLEGGDGAGG